MSRAASGPTAAPEPEKRQLIAQEYQAFLVLDDREAAAAKYFNIAADAAGDGRVTWTIR